MGSNVCSGKTYDRFRCRAPPHPADCRRDSAARPARAGFTAAVSGSAKLTREFSQALIAVAHLRHTAGSSSIRTKMPPTIDLAQAAQFGTQCPVLVPERRHTARRFSGEPVSGNSVARQQDVALAGLWLRKRIPIVPIACEPGRMAKRCLRASAGASRLAAADWPRTDGTFHRISLDRGDLKISQIGTAGEGGAAQVTGRESGNADIPVEGAGLTSETRLLWEVEKMERETGIEPATFSLGS